MDRNDREILSLTKKLLAELRAISATLLGVKNQIETVAEQQKTQSEREQTPPVLRAELQIPEAIEADRKRDGGRKVWREWTAIGLNVLTLLALVAYTIINGRMLREMRISTENAGISADAAKRSADTANLALHVSEKAYIALQLPELDEEKGITTIAIDNNGRLPATDFEVTIHEETCNAIVDIPPGIVPQAGMVFCPEYHRTRLTHPSIPPGIAKTKIDIPLPAFSRDKIDIGKQAIVIAGTLRYTDGFPDDPIQDWAFCFQTTYHLVKKAIIWGSCDTSIVIPKMEALENQQGNKQK